LYGKTTLYNSLDASAEGSASSSLVPNRFAPTCHIFELVSPLRLDATQPDHRSATKKLVPRFDPRDDPREAMRGSRPASLPKTRNMVTKLRSIDVELLLNRRLNARFETSPCVESYRLDRRAVRWACLAIRADLFTSDFKAISARQFHGGIGVMRVSEQLLSQHDQSNGTSLYASYRVLYTGLRDEVYPFALRLWPEGNDHGWGHIERVLEYLDRLAGPNPLSALGLYEVYLAMISVLYHDIGMLRGRSEHSIASQSIIDGMLGDRYIPDKLAREIASIAARTHSSNEDIAANFISYPIEVTIGGERVRPRTVAALVRLADELDEDYRRAPEAARAISRLNDSPYWHFCSVITGVTPRNLGNSQEVEIDVRLVEEDLVRTFGGDESRAFLAFFAEKIAKLNIERERCNAFLPEALRVERIRVRYRGFTNLLSFRIPTTATLEDGARAQAVLAPLSGPVEALIAQKVSEAKTLLAEGDAAGAYTAFHSVYRASDGFPTPLRRERLRALYNMACACCRQAAIATNEAQRWLDQGMTWLKQWIDEGAGGGWKAVGDSTDERVESLRIDEDLRMMREHRREEILKALPQDLRNAFIDPSRRSTGSGGGGGGGCLAAGTLLLCPGGERAVEDLRAGDDVMSFDPETGQLIVAGIEAIGHLDNVASLEINRTWMVSRSQRLLLVDGAWIPAHELRAGMQLVSAIDAKPLQIQEIVECSPTRVFELRTNHITHNIVSRGAVLHNVKAFLPLHREWRD
jgi:hypothetical protein